MRADRLAESLRIVRRSQSHKRSVDVESFLIMLCGSQCGSDNGCFRMPDCRRVKER